jgi:ribosomal protein S18 acetylase RimI-like enzyme
MEELIREIHDDEIDASASIIRSSFMTVAKEFHITQENCASNPAFITSEKLMESKNKGIKFFGLFLGDIQIGCVAIEKAKDHVFYMERLAVVPEHRHKGYGKELTDFVFKYADSQGGQKVSIGIINENIELKHWYAEYGFTETSIRKYDHLPFTVCFMEKRIDNTAIASDSEVHTTSR